MHEPLCEPLQCCGADWSAISELCCDWSVLVGPLSLALLFDRWTTLLRESFAACMWKQDFDWIFPSRSLFKRNFVRKWQRNVKLQKGYLNVRFSSIYRVHSVQLFSCRFPIHFVGGESRRLDRVCRGTFYFLFNVTHPSCYLGCVGQKCITYPAFYGRSGLLFCDFCIV